MEKVRINEACENILLMSQMGNSCMFCCCFRADLNGDSMLTIQELARFINRRIREHIEDSIRNNPIHFSEIDQSPRNGLITWDEYSAHLLRQRGFDEKLIKEVQWGEKSNLDRKTKELLSRDRALWNEAARTDSFSLTLDEFLAFRHPGTVIYFGQISRT